MLYYNVWKSNNIIKADWRGNTSINISTPGEGAKREDDKSIQGEQKINKLNYKELKM